MLEQARVFDWDGEAVSAQRYGNGHINLTYLVVTDAGKRYILQRVNDNVFRDPEALMGNITAVTTHLQKMAADPRGAVKLIPTKDGRQWFYDRDGAVWRAMGFVEGSICLEQAASSDDFRESAVAFGGFQRMLGDFPAHTLAETIPYFHHTPRRFAALHQAIKDDAMGRAGDVRREIDFAMQREAYAAKLVNLQQSGDLPLRVTHNDTKLNNVLFDSRTRKALCVIDLDTVMPGLAVNDYGDSIRFGASTAAEDETDLERVEMSMELFEAYTQGFLWACGDELTDCEVDCLCDGAKMMTLECGVRFLTDYLAGDTYFRIHRPEHNLERCRTQFKLAADMEGKWDEMKAAVRRAAQGR